MCSAVLVVYGSLLLLEHLEVLNVLLVLCTLLFAPFYPL